MLDIIQKIDDIAVSMAKSADFIVLTFEGFYELMVKTNPTQNGLMEFLFYADQASARQLDDMSTKMEADLTDLLERSLSDSEKLYFSSMRDSLQMQDTAYSAFGAIVVQAKIDYARNLRNVIAAKVFNLDTYNHNPRIMSRNGKKWDFYEYVYLTARQMLVDWYNFVKISYLVEKGYKEFKLLTSQEDLIDSVYSVEDYPSLATTLFHPRTTKLVGQGVE